MDQNPPNPHPRVAASERTALLLLTTVTPVLTSIQSVIWLTAQIPSFLPPRPPDEGVLGIQGPGQRRAIVNSNPPVGRPIDPLQSKMGTPAVVERGGAGGNGSGFPPNAQLPASPTSRDVLSSTSPLSIPFWLCTFQPRVGIVLLTRPWGSRRGESEKIS